MARIYVEFGCYGAIGDFECDNMTEEEISEACNEILWDFVISEGYNAVRVEDDEDY